MLAEFQDIIPDVWIGPDGTLFLLLQVESGQFEGAYLANQILLEDMFIPSASFAALQRFGDMYGFPQKAGTKATGNLLFSGIGGEFISIGDQAVFDPGGGNDPVTYETTASATLPNPGIPSAPTIVDGGAGLISGTLEYAITFLTTQGETTLGATSNPLSITTRSVNLTNIPIGGPGTTGRRIYRSKNGGAFQFVTTIANNTATTINDNIADGSLGGGPPTVSTAESVLVSAESAEAGSNTNAVIGAIRTLSNASSGITSVTNPQPFTGGSDPEETEAYRQRLLQFVRNPQSGSAADLQTWALTVPGVETATVFTNDNLGTPQNGHATIRIAGPQGTIPSAAVLDAVLATLNLHDFANITLHVTTFTSVSTNVTVTITVSTGFALSEISTNITQAIQDYINAIPVGGTLYVAGIVDSVFGLPGVTNVVVNTPATDQTTAATSKRVPGVITVS